LRDCVTDSGHDYREGIGGSRRGGLWLRRVIAAAWFASLLFIPLFCSYGAPHIVLYHVGEKDQEARTLLKKHLAGKGFTVTAYDGTDRIEKHVELANKINRLRASLFIAVEFVFGEKESVVIAVSNAKKTEAQVLAIEELPALYINSSKEFAALVAEPFKRKVLDLPLFPLLGIDMPGVFMRIVCPRDQTDEFLSKLSDSVQKYLSKGMKK
jgi:hypothetical protein